MRFPEEGFYNLSAKDIHGEALRLYEDFFLEQTPLKAFRLSIVLYHLLEWIVPCGNDDQKPNAPREGEPSLELWRAELAFAVRNHLFYQVLKSLANNSKHHTLRSRSYEKGVEFGVRAGRSVAGERLGQANLVIFFNGEEVWLREVFESVLALYTRHLNKEGMLEALLRTAENPPSSMT